MPELLSFEWERPAQGYKLMEWTEFHLELFKGHAREMTTIAPDYLQEPANLSDKDLFSFRSMIVIDNENPLILPDYVLLPVVNKWTCYQPLRENHAIFMEFAKLKAWSELAEFLSKYGPLWEIVGQAGKRSGVVSCDELFFTAMLGSMFARGVELWDQCKVEGEYAKLIDYFNYDGPYSRTSSPDGGRGAVGVVPHLAHNRAGGVPVFSLKPSHLAGAIHLQFAQAVTNDSQLQKCAVCPTWFAYGTGTGRRKSAHYCSDKCRKAAHRRQKAEKHNG